MTGGPAKTTNACARPRYPDFIVIGAMKAGTTTLYQHLRRHPGILMADPKEPNYFSIDSVYSRGLPWYQGLFAAAGEDQLCGEVSPSYTRYPRFPDTPDRMARACPGVKLIYLMRHPVERFYSNYVFDRSFGHNEAIRDTLHQRPYVLETSRYLSQINRYLDFFPREQLHLIVLDDLRSDASAVLSRLAGFLGVAEFDAAPSEEVHANRRGDQHTVRQGNRLLSAARSAPGAKSLAALLPESARGAVRRIVSDVLPKNPVSQWMNRRRLGRIEPLTAELRAELHERLDPDTRALEEFLGRDLSGWRRADREGAAS